jgi:transcriptional antiterminator NusG
MIMTDESWHLVRNVRGVTGFVGTAGKAIPLTEQEIYDLGVERHEVLLGYDVGDTVKVTDGPLEGFLGVVEALEPEKDRVRVIVSMFGRETPVELELDQVDPVKES